MLWDRWEVRVPEEEQRHHDHEPTLASELEQLIQKYGEQAVRQAVGRREDATPAEDNAHQEHSSGEKPGEAEPERKIELSPQLQAVKAVRQAGSNAGFREISVRREQADDKTSDVLITWNTFTDGEWHARVTAEPRQVLLYVSRMELRSSKNTAITLVGVLRSLEPDVTIRVIDMSENAEVDLPKDPIPSPPDNSGQHHRPAPLDQELHYDVRTGRWYGHPRSK